MSELLTSRFNNTFQHLALNDISLLVRWNAKHLLGNMSLEAFRVASKLTGKNSTQSAVKIYRFPFNVNDDDGDDWREFVCVNLWFLMIFNGSCLT